jgi:hypothetical protein
MDLGHQGWLIDLLVILSGTQTWQWKNLHLWGFPFVDDYSDYLQMIFPFYTCFLDGFS